MNQVLEWVKANIFIVVFGVLMIASLVALPILSSRMNESVKDLVDKRARMINSLKALEKTEVKPPEAGQPVASQQALVNEQLLADYEALAEEMREDADEVIAAAIEFNRKNHTVFMENVLPSMPLRQAEVLPQRFHGVMVRTYRELFEQVGAGMPPSADELAAELERNEINFISQSVQKDSREDLTPDELKELTKKLTEVRLAKNREQAEGIGIYLDPERAVMIEPWDQTRIPGEPWMFNWNWQYWVVHDVLMALHHANEGSEGTVLRAPVKRVLRLDVFDLPDVPRTANGGAAARPGMSAGGRSASGGATAGGSGDDAGSGSLQPPDPTRPVPPDYTVRFTGRKSNPLYDVLMVELDLIVDSTRIPAVLDAIAAENFFTVVDLVLQPVDSFRAAAEGFMYGNDPVCRLNLTIETVWLRQWTTERMPDKTRERLGVPPRETGTAETDA